MANDIVAFQMWGKIRERLIYECEFYFQQAETRLLNQFQNKEKEARDASEKWLADNSARFNPDVHDGADFMEAAGEAGNDLYQLLSEMEKTTKLSVSASLFHEWDKQLRDWLIREIMHWHRLKDEDGNKGHVEKQIWKQNFHGIMDLMEVMIPNLKSSDYFKVLDECRLVVNVYKHGDGGAFEDLKANHPQYLKDWYETGSPTWAQYKDYTSLNISYDQLKSLTNAICAFWKAIPENTHISKLTSVPDWFGKAFEKDINNAKGA